MRCANNQQSGWKRLNLLLFGEFQPLLIGLVIAMALLQFGVQSATAQSEAGPQEEPLEQMEASSLQDLIEQSEASPAEEPTEQPEVSPPALPTEQLEASPPEQVPEQREATPAELPTEQPGADSMELPSEDFNSVSKYEDSWSKHTSPKHMSPKHMSSKQASDTCDFVCPGWYASGEFLAWRVRHHGLDYAISSGDDAVAVGIGAVDNVAFSRDTGYRLGLGYVTRTGWDLGFRFTDFDTDQSASAVAPAGGTLWATRSHPILNEEALTANAYAAMEYQTFDFEVGRWFEVNRFAAIRMVGGLRWLNADQQLTIQYDGNQFTNGLVFDQKSDRAFGIRIGAEGHWNLLGGWSAFARGTGTVAYTKSDLRMLETDDSGADLIVDVTDSFTGSIANFEAAVGLSWKRGNWDISSGYEMTNWSNLSNRTTFDGVHEGSYDSVPLDLLMEGLFFGVTYSH